MPTQFTPTAEEFKEYLNGHKQKLIAEIEGKINASVKRKTTYRAKMQCFKTFETQIKNALKVSAEVEG